MIEQLLRHPEIKLTSLLAKTDVGKPVSDFFPHLRGFCDQVVEDSSPERIGQDADVVIFSTPDRVGMAYAPQLVGSGVKMIDYSGDFRFGSIADYQEYARRHPGTAGREHASPDLIGKAVYGVPELYRERLRGASLVGNPGCFAVAMILALAPAVKAGLVDISSIIVDGKTGSSGAGKKPGPVHHYPERNENVTPYRIASHQHNVEVVQTLSRLAGGQVTLTFVPHVVPATRGILCTCYASFSPGATLAQAREAYAAFYSGEPFVRLMPSSVIPTLKSVYTSNFCDIGLAADESAGKLIVISAIDNLVKGQAGVALQNINLMLGLPETMGLDRAPTYP